MAEYSLQALQKIDLTQPEKYADYVGYLRENVLFKQVMDANKVQGFFAEWFAANEGFRTTHPDNSTELDLLLLENKWCAVVAATEDEIVDLFTNHFGVLYAIPQRYPEFENIELVQDIVLNDIRVRLIQQKDFDLRDKFKGAIISALSGNEAVITTADFYSGVRAVPASAAQWLKHYLENVDKDHSQFSRSRFLKKSDNIQRLNDTERGLVELLFNTYERLRISSWDPEGMEEVIPYDEDPDGEMPVYGVIEYGQLKPYPKSTHEELQTLMKNIQDLNDETGSTATSSRPPVNHAHLTNAAGKLTQRGPNLNATKGPDHFTEEDAAEIQQHAKAGKELSASSGRNYKAEVGSVVHGAGIVFTTPELEKKFTNLAMSVLRGVRTIEDLQGYLVDMDYDETQSTKIITAIKDHQKNAENSAGNSNEHLDAASLAVGAVQSQAAVGANQSTGSAAVSEAQPIAQQPQGIRSFIPKLRRSRRAKKAMIDDIKIQESMVMGPIDELKAMDIIEFRRLSNTPSMAANKIKDKIDLLAEDSITKQAEGVDAFKQSSLNTMYVEVGNSSMLTGKPVEGVLAEMLAAGSTVLTIDEFNSLADLNRQLRF